MLVKHGQAGPIVSLILVFLLQQGENQKGNRPSSNRGLSGSGSEVVLLENQQATPAYGSRK